MTGSLLIEDPVFAKHMFARLCAFTMTMMMYGYDLQRRWCASRLGHWSRALVQRTEMPKESEKILKATELPQNTYSTEAVASSTYQYPQAILC